MRGQRPPSYALSMLVLTTNPGLEDVVEGELRGCAAEAGIAVERVEHPYEARPGRVLVSLATERQRAVDLALRLRTIHHILRPIARVPLAAENPLAALRAAAASLTVPELVEARSFRVTGTRKGSHDFTSIDLQRAVGAGLVDAHGTAVSMKDFDVEIRADVLDARCDIGVQITRRALSRGAWRPYRPRTALKTNVAVAMLTLAAAAPPGVLLDPFCGSGTILLEAAATFPQARLIGIEKFHKPFAGAQENLAHFGIAAELLQRDGRFLEEHLPAGSVDLIVTNPPFGVRLGGQVDFDWFYERVLAGAAHVLRPGGRIALLAWHRGPLNRALRRNRALHSVHVRILETGGLYPGFFLLQRGALEASSP